MKPPKDPEDPQDHCNISLYVRVGKGACVCADCEIVLCWFSCC